MTDVNPSSPTCDPSSRSHSLCQDGTDAPTSPIVLDTRENNPFFPRSTRETSHTSTSSTLAGLTVTAEPPTCTRALDSQCRKTQWKGSPTSTGCCDVVDGSHREGCYRSACQHTTPTVSHFSAAVVVNTASTSSAMTPHHTNPTPGTTQPVTPVSPTVYTRTVTASGVVDYMGVARKTLWRALGRCLAAALLPHLFMWLAVSILVPQAENKIMRESATSPPLDLYAVTRNHPELAFILLEVSMTGLLGSGLVHFLAIFPQQGPRTLGAPPCASSYDASGASMNSKRNCDHAHRTLPNSPTGTLTATTEYLASQQDFDFPGSSASSPPLTGIPWMKYPTPAWLDASKAKECASSAGHQTNPLPLCLGSPKDPHTLALSRTFRCHGRVPSITSFGFFIGYVAYIIFGTWRLAITYYFAWYSYELDDNAAVWFWLLPAGVLTTVTYVLLLIGGHTLRRRALQQLEENIACRYSESKREQKITARRVAAATATMRRLRWVSWCLVCVPHPHPEAASNLTWPGTAGVFSSPLADQDKMQGVVVGADPGTSTPAAPITYMEDHPCGDAGTSTLKKGLSKRTVVDIDGSKSHSLLEGASASGGDAQRVAQKMTTRGAFAGNPPSEAATPFATPFAAMDRPSSGFHSVQLPRCTPSKFYTVKLWFLTILKNIDRCRCAPTSSLRCLPWMWARRQESAPTEVQPWDILPSWVSCAYQGLHISRFPMRAWHWCSVAARPLEQFEGDSLRALECALVWLYLLMLFFFTTLLLCLLYFTWWWRRIVGITAAAAMYATDTENVTVPLPPSLEVYRCTKVQQTLRSVVWVLPPVCSLPDVGAVSEGPLKWSASSRIALLFTLMGKRRYQVPYFYANIALPIGFACILFLFLHELLLHPLPHRVLRYLRLDRFLFEMAAW